jgi:hypothetical protein
VTQPPRWHTREDSGLRLDREGRWWHDDELVEHPRVIEAFNRGLEPAEGGRFVLRIGQDWCFVRVDGAAYRVIAVDDAPGGPWVRLSDRTAEPLAGDSVRLDEDGAFTCGVKAGRARARFSRDAQFQLSPWLDEEAGRYVLRLPSGRFPLANVYAS